MVGNELVLKKLLSRTHRGWGGKGVAGIRFVTSLALKGIEFVTKKRSERVVIEPGTTQGRERGDLEMENVKKVFKIFSNSTLTICTHEMMNSIDQICTWFTLKQTAQQI